MQEGWSGMGIGLVIAGWRLGSGEWGVGSGDWGEDWMGMGLSWDLRFGFWVLSLDGFDDEILFFT